jgi:metal-dependent amidase/aminoacylase/carboxypeptidase family protein
VAILAEYDALPEIGHACGHNLIAAGALGAFLALAAQREALAGTVELIGTPAEEGGGGKIRLLEAGVFEGVDAAMMFHPFDRDLLAHFTLANVWIEMRFSGRPSHAAIAPWEGQSALTACMDTFRLIDGQRVHFRDGVRVHGYIQTAGRR